jgi:hypothetical protein
MPAWRVARLSRCACQHLFQCGRPAFPAWVDLRVRHSRMPQAVRNGQRPLADAVGPRDQSRATKFCMWRSANATMASHRVASPSSQRPRQYVAYLQSVVVESLHASRVARLTAHLAARWRGLAGAVRCRRGNGGGAVARSAVERGRNSHSTPVSPANNCGKILKIKWREVDARRFQIKVKQGANQKLPESGAAAVSTEILDSRDRNCIVALSTASIACGHRSHAHDHCHIGPRPLP